MRAKRASWHGLMRRNIGRSWLSLLSFLLSSRVRHVDIFIWNLQSSFKLDVPLVCYEETGGKRFGRVSLLTRLGAYVAGRAACKFCDDVRFPTVLDK